MSASPDAPRHAVAAFGEAGRLLVEVAASPDPAAVPHADQEAMMRCWIARAVALDQVWVDESVPDNEDLSARLATDFVNLLCEMRDDAADLGFKYPWTVENARNVRAALRIA